MKPLAIVFLGCFAASSALADQCAPWLKHSVSKLRSDEQINLCQATANKPVLIVNTASHCGYTYQFKQLESTYQSYKDKGLVVIGFPSNDFNQESKDAAVTAKVCYVNYGVTFLMTDKVKVKGDAAHPVFKHLGKKQGQPDWNFNKFLVDSKGNVTHRFPSSVEPTSKEFKTAVESVL